MFDMMLENYSKAVESTLKVQQEMLRNWTVVGPQSTVTSTPTGATPAASWLEQLSTARMKWAEVFTDMLKREQETLEEQYRAGIRAIDDAFRVVEAKDLEQFRRLSEEMWRRSLETFKTSVESQMHDVQVVMKKLFEGVPTGAAGSKA